MYLNPEKDDSIMINPLKNIWSAKHYSQHRGYGSFITNLVPSLIANFLHKRNYR